MATVRLDDDVRDALQADVKAHGGTVTGAANEAIRRGLHLVKKARVGYAPPPLDDPKSCRHPVNLRIGKGCAGCGATL